MIIQIKRNNIHTNVFNIKTINSQTIQLIYENKDSDKFFKDFLNKFNLIKINKHMINELKNKKDNSYLEYELNKRKLKTYLYYTSKYKNYKNFIYDILKEYNSIIKIKD